MRARQAALSLPDTVRRANDDPAVGTRIDVRPSRDQPGGIIASAEFN